MVNCSFVHFRALHFSAMAEQDKALDILLSHGAATNVETLQDKRYVLICQLIHQRVQAA